jgi:hypothetical protein
MKLTQAVVREFLHYDPDTGVFTWLPRDQKWFPTYRSYRWWNSRFAYKRAGTVHTNHYGYKHRRINIDHKPTQEHKIAWLWMVGDELPECIDHINRDATDNRWENIRPSSYLGNAKNSSKQSNNTSGVTSVFWSKSYNKWFALSSHNGRRKFLGYFKEIDEAAMAVLEFKADHGYEISHGMELAHYHQKQ